MSTPPPSWRAPAPLVAAPAPRSRGGLGRAFLWCGATLATAVVALVGYVVGVVVLAPLLLPHLLPLLLGPDATTVGAGAGVVISVVVSTPARVVAGVTGALVLRLGRGHRRSTALACAGAGAVLAWCGFAGLSVLGAGSLEVLQDDRLWWELLRWVAETCLGALLVPRRRSSSAGAPVLP